MNKNLIGVLRIVAVYAVAFMFDLSLDPFDLKLWLSDLIHGGHTVELRNSVSVSLSMTVILVLVSFYIMQSLVYILIGTALEGKNTSIFAFFKHVYRGLRDVGNEDFFSDSSGGNLDSINRVLEYRDSKMALMSNREAAEYMKGTGHIDFMLNNPNLKQSKKTLSFLNNKTALMSNEKALEYLKNK